MIEVLQGPADSVLAFKMSGRVTDEEFRQVVEPACAALFLNQAAPNLLIEIGADFRKFTSTAFWDNPHIGLHRASGFARIAIIADVGWIVSAARAMKTPDRIRAFPAADYAPACDWLIA